MPMGSSTSALANALARRSIYRTLAAWWTLEPGADFRQADAQFGHCAAQRVAVDTQFLRSLTLVSFIRRQHFAQILSFKLFHGILITNAGGMHLGYQAVQVSSHV